MDLSHLATPNSGQKEWGRVSRYLCDGFEQNRHNIRMLFEKILLCDEEKPSSYG